MRHGSQLATGHSKIKREKGLIAVRAQRRYQSPICMRCCQAAYASSIASHAGISSSRAAKGAIAIRPADCRISSPIANTTDFDAAVASELKMSISRGHLWLKFSLISTDISLETPHENCHLAYFI